MTQPLGNCPGCGADEPFEQVHDGECPDVAGECPEWACTGCGAGVVMGTAVMGTAVMGAVIMGISTGPQATGSPGSAAAPARQSVRAA